MSREFKIYPCTAWLLIKLVPVDSSQMYSPLLILYSYWMVTFSSGFALSCANISLNLSSASGWTLSRSERLATRAASNRIWFQRKGDVAHGAVFLINGNYLEAFSSNCIRFCVRLTSWICSSGRKLERFFFLRGAHSSAFWFSTSCFLQLRHSWPAIGKAACGCVVHFDVEHGTRDNHAQLLHKLDPRWIEFLQAGKLYHAINFLIRDEWRN